ncbi:MAG: YdeI/OmpD-associated family protein [Pseudomonadota bacterium]
MAATRAGEHLDRVEVVSRSELRAWLEQNHASGRSVWLVTWKKHSPHYLPYPDMIQELLCWGWIDSKTRSVDADRTSVLVAPRNPKSAWSAINKAHVAEARAAGLMADAGEALIQAAKANGMWTFLDDVERLERPADLEAALEHRVEGWEAWPRSVKRGTLEWIKTAKTEATRTKRIANVVASLDAGLRPSPFRR